MKNIDIFCSTSKNRIKEVENLLIPSLKNQSFEGQISLYLTNYKGDNQKLLKKSRNSNKLNIKELQPSNPVGFGEAHNFAFKEIKPKENFLIVNSDMYLHKQCLENLLEIINKDIGLVEARQLPFTHPKDKNNSKPFETNWASGSCLLINSKFFKKVRGFDKNYWMYLEDVDLSWKSWINGYKVIQNPKAVAYHYTGAYFKYNDNTYELEDFWSLRNFFYISYVYWGDKGLNCAKKLLHQTPHNDRIKEKAYDNFQNLIKSEDIKHIIVPKELNNKIKVFGYNKFSQYPK